MLWGEVYFFEIWNTKQTWKISLPRRRDSGRLYWRDNINKRKPKNYHNLPLSQLGREVLSIRIVKWHRSYVVEFNTSTGST